jgi:hypothetical protein
MIMKKLISLFFISVIAVSLSGWTLVNDGAMRTSYNYFEPVDPDMEFNPCTGEFIVFEGLVHEHGSTTVMPGGNVHLSYHSNLQGVTGVGQTTGNIYHYICNQNGHVNVNVGSVTTIIFNAMIISNGDQYVSQVRQQYTVNANGEVVVDTFFMEISCN